MPSRSGIQWATGTITQSPLWVNLATFDAKLDVAMKALVHYHAIRIETALKSKAPWTDRTGTARSGLFAVDKSGSKNWSVVMAHSVDYGIWLEVKYSGRYATITPRLQEEGPNIMDDATHIFGSILT